MSNPKYSRVRHKPKSIGLLGASFDTGNMGVSALAESAIKCILHRWPDAEITLLDSGRLLGEHWLSIGDKDVCVRKLPIRFCKNVFLGNHFVVLCLHALLFKVFRWEKLKRFCAQHNASLKRIIRMDMVADITGGDSFSDIYGMRRFVLGFLCKWLVLLLNKELVMLPQTYGPFRRRLSRALTRYILRHASVVYSRDREGIECVNILLNNAENNKVRITPDVAFVLDSHKPEHLSIKPSTDIRAQNSIVVGLNISGLLFNGGYTRNNMFGLKSNYRESIYAVIEMLLKDKTVAVLLVPHVFPPVGYEVESDPDACLNVYEKLKQIYPGRIFLVKGEYDQGEIKYIIGLSDFFIGSRMHACIAALSQSIPAVGIAYSKKFYGVFESVGVEELVVDMRRYGKDEILVPIKNAFKRREFIAERLRGTIPKVRAGILNMFNDIELQVKRHG